MELSLLIMGEIENFKKKKNTETQKKIFNPNIPKTCPENCQYTMTNGKKMT